MIPAAPARRVFAVHHGETAWSLSGQHTGVTDIPLADHGRRLARGLRPVLTKESFACVLTSPLQRARETYELVGLDTVATIEADLVEWDYGKYERLTPAQIHASAPGWLIFRDGCPACLRDVERPRPRHRRDGGIRERSSIRYRESLRDLRRELQGRRAPASYPA
jgi:broad specificity phosphatase PhoE